MRAEVAYISSSNYPANTPQIPICIRLRCFVITIDLLQDLHVYLKSHEWSINR